MENGQDYTTLLYSKYFGKHVMAFKLFGVPFADNQSLLYKAYSFICIFCLLFTFAVVEFLELFRNEASVLTEALLFQSAASIACFKFVVFLTRRAPIRRILLKLQQKPFLPKIKNGDDIENKLLQQCFIIVKIQTYVYWVGACIAIILLSLYIPLLASIQHKPLQEWKLPFGPFTLFNATESSYYNVIYWYQSAALYVTTGLFSTSDTLFTAILVHVSFQFRILQHRIRTAVSETDNNEKQEQFLKRTLVKLVNHHRAILDVVQEMEDIFNILLLWTFLSTLSWLSTYIYLASTATDRSKMIVYLNSAACAALQAFLVCYWAEQVIYESEMVGLAAYESFIPGINLSYQKSLVLIIRRSRNASVLTAGKFAIVNIPTLAWIIRTSYSAFVVLRRTTDDL